MTIQNADVADIFNRVANLLEIDEANPFRVRAYRNAARTVSGLGRRVAEMVAEGEDLSQLSGVGKDLAGKIAEIVQTGTLVQLETIEKRIPPKLNDLMRIPGLGPKRVRALHRELGITDKDELRAAVEAHRVRELEGFGEKTEQSLRDALAEDEGGEERISLLEAEQRAGPLVDYLEASADVKRVTVAGSYRRRKETVGDLDILVTCKRGADVMDRFTGYENVRKVVSQGETRSTVVLKSGLQVDLRVLPEVGYGAGLHYFTGSKAHNIAVRKRGVGKGFKINEYGVFKDDRRVAGKTEEEVYEKVGLAFIPPELREDTGEIEAAEKGRLPELVCREDIRGDLHVHTDATDGQDRLEDMVAAARELGYAYLAITDHSKKVTMAKGLDAERLEAQIHRIDRLNDQLEGFRVLKGIEVDILEDGTLDLPDSILGALDLRVCSVHYAQNLPRGRQTRRIIKAMENPFCNILGHPTGRILGQRRGYAVDLEKIIDAARDLGCFMELNAEPERLDLSDVHCRMALDKGVRVAVSTDAHSAASLAFMRFGIDQARRGWLTADDVLNTRGCDALLELLRRT
jgi:DNA polymerase (family X)